jgi:hypothetical protein
LKGVWFQPLSLRSENLVSNLCFSNVYRNLCRYIKVRSKKKKSRFSSAGGEVPSSASSGTRPAGGAVRGKAARGARPAMA